MDIDWGKMITEVLVVVLPTLVTFVLAWSGAQWGKLKQNESYGNTLSTLESLAYQFVLAAYQMGENAGWDAAKRREYVIERLRAVAVSMKLNLSDEDLGRVLDAILEGAYAEAKSHRSISPVNVGN